MPKPIKDKASRMFKPFKDKVMGLYDRTEGPERNPKKKNQNEQDSFAPYEVERAFFFGGGGSFRINGRSRMDVETFLKETRGSVANLPTKDLQDLDTVKVQTTAWIRFKVEVDDGGRNVIRIDTVDKLFNSRMTEVFQGSNWNEVIDEMFAYMRTQIENLALVNNRFMFDRVLFLDINFHQLNLTRGSSYLRLPD